ncbi:MAG: hypothetical protein FDZ75_01045, partial [Actinobacteria bacterium]
ACMAHINRARFPGQYFTGARASKTPAKLIVIDPRKSRTAAQADMYVRIRPGTDIALANGIARYIMDLMNTSGALYSDGSAVPASVQTEYFAYLNQTGSGTFFTDGNASASSSQVGTVPGNSKYSDARFLVNGTGDDYDRHRTLATDGWNPTATGPDATTISDFPKKATSIRDGLGGYTANTVYAKLWDHVNPYTLPVVADICDCTEAEIKAIADAMIQNSRPASTSQAGSWTRRFKLTTTSGIADKQPMWAYNAAVSSITWISGTGTGGTLVAGTDYTVATGTSSRALGTIERVNTSTKILSGDVVEVTYTGMSDQAPNSGYRAMTLLYAMGITQHTYGSQNVKSFAVLQTLLGNNGRAGGGINALRGIHNVQGSTDMGVLYHLIPGYSGNPSTQPDAIPSTNNAFGKYMDGLWGLPLSGNNGRSIMNNSYDDAYNTASGVMQLQQRGFFNMTLKWFGDYGTIAGMAVGAAKRTLVDACYALWPKGNGDNHVQMFRKMSAGTINAAIVWGQNPAVTEPNQGKVREGLKKVPLLVCVDMFETETAGVERDPGTVTYLLPASSHVEKAGSATNSGRTLQWRYKAIDPQGNSKDDTELLLRFAKALDTAGAFSHIRSVWSTYGIFGGGNVYTNLYQNAYGGFTGAAGTYNGLSGSGDYVTMRNNVSDSLAVNNVAGAPALVSINTAATLTGSEWVAEKLYQEYTTGVTGGGTVWLYTEGYDTANKNAATGVAAAAPRLTGDYTPWVVANRSKSRDRMDPYGGLQSHKWGYSWLVNRRVIYNNGEVAGDQSDFFMSPDSVSRIFAPAPTATLRGSGGGATLYP